MQLIPRLYDATEGTVKVGGLDVKSYDIEALRNQVAVVLQKNILFSGSIMDNLRWGDENATEEEMKQACELAQADEFIMQFLTVMPLILSREEQMSPVDRSRDSVSQGHC